MDFNFIPFRLNADIIDFKDNIKYISSENGVDLYKGREELKMPLLGFQIADANLYFFEGSLITVYIQLEKTENIEKVKEVFDKSIMEIGQIMQIDTGLMYCWQSKSQFLGLFAKENEGLLLSLYYSLNKFNVYDQ